MLAALMTCLVVLLHRELGERVSRARKEEGVRGILMSWRSRRVIEMRECCVQGIIRGGHIERFALVD